MLSGAGVIAYALAWLLLPAPGGPGVLQAQADTSTGRIVAGIAVAVAALLLIGGIVNTLVGGGLFGSSSGLGALVVLALLVGAGYLLARQRNLLPYAGPPTAAPTTDPVSATAPTGTASSAEAIITTSAAPTARLGGPVVRVAAPRRFRPRRRRLSPSVALTLSGLSLLVGVGLTTLHERLDWPGDSRTIALSGALGLVALVLLVGGLLGRKGGLTSLLALILALGVGGSAVASDPLWSSGSGDRVLTIAPGSVNESARLALGTVAIDLTRLSADASATTRQVDTELGLGEVTVKLPKTGSVRIDARVLLGQILVGDVPEKGQPVRDIDYHRTFGTGPLVAVVDVDMRAGVVKIVGSTP